MVPPPQGKSSLDRSAGGGGGAITPWVDRNGTSLYRFDSMGGGHVDLDRCSIMFGGLLQCNNAWPLGCMCLVMPWAPEAVMKMCSSEIGCACQSTRVRRNQKAHVAHTLPICYAYALALSTHSCAPRSMCAWPQTAFSLFDACASRGVSRLQVEAAASFERPCVERIRIGLLALARCAPQSQANARSVVSHAPFSRQVATLPQTRGGRSSATLLLPRSATLGGWRYARSTWTSAA